MYLLILIQHTYRPTSVTYRKDGLELPQRNDSRERQVLQNGWTAWETLPMTPTDAADSQGFNRDGNAFPGILNSFPIAHHDCDHIADRRNSGGIRRVTAGLSAFGDDTDLRGALAGMRAAQDRVPAPTKVALLF